MAVLDASAILAFLNSEVGTEVVAEHLDGAIVGAANWSEVAQKIRSAEADWPIASSVLLSYGVAVEPVSLADAEAAAVMWRRGSGLSLADRLCLALGQRLGQQVVTADHAWGSADHILQIRART